MKRRICTRELPHRASGVTPMGIASSLLCPELRPSRNPFSLLLPLGGTELLCPFELLGIADKTRHRVISLRALERAQKHGGDFRASRRHPRTGLEDLG